MFAKTFETALGQVVALARQHDGQPAIIYHFDLEDGVELARSMRGQIITYLPWLLSIITIYMTILAGNKTRWAWLIGLGNQALWLIWIFASSAWGLLPMNIALWIVYGRNHLKWMKA